MATVGRWRYALYDLLTGTLLAEHLPFDVDQFTIMLGEAGTVQATLPLGDAAIRSRRPRELIVPRRTNLVMFRDEVPVWDGIIWSRRRGRDDRTNTSIFAAAEIRSYFAKRQLRPELGYGSAKTLSFTQTDSFVVFRAIIRDALNISISGLQPGNLRIDIDDGQLSGVLIDRRDAGSETTAYHGYSFQTYAQLLDDLAGTDPGLEWRLDPYLDVNGALRRRLVLGSPNVGVAGDDPNLATLEYPGDILSYEWPDDGESSANYLAALGNGEGDAMRWAEAYNTAELSAGYPLTEATSSHKDDTSTTILGQKAIADLGSMSGDRTVPSLTINGWASFTVGDHVRVRITDEDWWPDSRTSPYEAVVRVVGKTVTPGEREKTVLAIEEPRALT